MKASLHQLRRTGRSVAQEGYTHVFKPYGMLPVAFRRATAALRPLPDFLIIGAQKAGTTSLHRYLSKHPKIVTGVWKEVNFFDWRYRYQNKGTNWYRSHFPMLANPKEYCVGEATPEYLLNPAVPERVAKTIPDVRLIVLLRNPIDRAFSHYHHYRRLGLENLSFEEAVEAEPDRIEDQMEKLRTEGTHDGRRYARYSYLTRGHYAEQIECWLEYFSEDQFLILESGAFFNKPEHTVQHVFSHLGVQRGQIEVEGAHGKGSYRESMGAAVRTRLQEYFKPKNEALYELIGRRFEWE